MAGNLVRKSILATGSTWTAPGGVYNIVAETVRQRRYWNNYGNQWIDDNGNIWGSGTNANGQLGNGTVAAATSPTQVIGGFTAKALNSAKHAGMCVANYMIASNGLCYAWGINQWGNLGVGDVTVRSSPVAVLRGLTFAKVFNGNDVGGIYFQTPTGDVYGCGNNTYGQLGVGDVTHRSSPVAMLGSLKFTKVSIGEGESFYGITSAGVAYACGRNENGQLGLGDVASRSSPVAILGSLTVKKIVIAGSSGEHSAIILTTAGTLYAMGENSKGQLGLGDVVARSSPVAVVGVSGLVFVDIGSDTAYGESYWALTSTGLCYMWGYNTYGQLGVGDVAARSSPVAVLRGLQFVKVDIGTGNFDPAVVAMTADGTMYGWGNNTKGALGTGDATAKSSPVAVVGGLKFTDFFVGSGGSSNGPCTVAISTNGLMYGWGNNDGGVLGVGDTTARSSPVAVIGASLAASRPEIVRTVVSVVPGTTYTINFNQYYAYFGGVQIGSGFVDSVILEYQS